MTTLTLAFTVPKTPDECISLGVSPMHVDSAIVYRADIDDLCAYDVDDMRERNTEIPVTRFLDLLHDRIVPWRLEEIGFDMSLRDYHKTVGLAIVSAEDDEVVIWHVNQRIVIPLYITTFTDLLTLIRMLTPPSNA